MKAAPKAAGKDPALYELLALIDAVRDRRVRERQLAEKDLSDPTRDVDAIVDLASYSK